MARLLKKPLVIALAAVILLVIGFFAYIQNAFTGTRCEAAKHLDADMIGDCYGCHLKVTPQVAQDWYESKHGVTLVRCQVCHGQPDGKGAVPFKRVPGVEVCAACHGLAIDKMTALYGTRPEDVLAAIGPGIGPCCFETHDDVPTALEDRLGPDEFLLRVRCSKGTYVRTLCHDIGAALGCGGCMSSLRRTMAAGFTLAHSVTLDTVLQAQDPAALLLPVDTYFSGYPDLVADPEQEKRIRNGAALPMPALADGRYRVYSQDGTFLALSQGENGILTTVKSFYEV